MLLDENCWFYPTHDDWRKMEPINGKSSGAQKFRHDKFVEWLNKYRVPKGDLHGIEYVLTQQYIPNAGNGFGSWTFEKTDRFFQSYSQPKTVQRIHEFLGYGRPMGDGM